MRFNLENPMLMNVCISYLQEVGNIFSLSCTARRCFWIFSVVFPYRLQRIADFLSQPKRLQDLTGPQVL